MLASLLVLGVGAWVVSDQRFIWGEAGMVEAFNSVPSAVGAPFRAIMHLGTLWVGLSVVVILAALGNRVGLRPAAATALSVAVAFRADNVLKNVIERPRPPRVIEGLAVREHVGGFSYPSGHTTMAVAIATSLHPVLPRRWRPVLWLAVVITALTRMHVAAHWPLDLVGGAALGVAIGSAARLLVALPRSARG